MAAPSAKHGHVGHVVGASGYSGYSGYSGFSGYSGQGSSGYSGRYAVSFIGAAPAEDPQFVVAVTVYKPRTVSNSIGATPSFKRIMQQLLRTYRVPPSTTVSANIPTEWK